MTFTEANTVEDLVRDILCGGVTHHTSAGPGLARRGGQIAGVGWHYLAAANVPRTTHEVLVEPWVRDTLIRLNPSIAAVPDRADEVIYKLRAIVLSIRSDGLLKANEEMMAWLRGDRSMPFGERHEHVTGEGFSAADIVLAGVLEWARVSGQLRGCAAVEAYLERVRARPAFQRASAD